MEEEKTVEQLIEQYPYLKNYMNKILFLEKSEVKKLSNGEKIIIDSKEVSVEFLKRIIDNDIFYDYVSRYLKKEINSFQVAYIAYGDTGGGISYNRGTIIRGMEKLVASGKISLNENEQKKYETLKNYISFEKFKEDNSKTNFDIDIEGNHYSIPPEELIKFMHLDDETFNNICSNNEIKTINGIPKEHFIFASENFFNKTKALEEYDIPEIITKHYEIIKSNQLIDIQALNKHLTTTDTKYKEANIDDSLKKAILNGMPENISDLEKAIYIYIKMCKLLTYDEEYYAVNQRGIATKKHKDINYISTITPDNNKVVCFEFNLIYAILLNELGIHFTSEYKGMADEFYGEGHANLEFRTGKYLVNADSVTTILLGDIMQAKLNQPLKGLKCNNDNLQTQKEFQESLTKIYKIIAEQDKTIETRQVEHVQTLDELLDNYSKLTKNIEELSFYERLSILIDKVNMTKMVGIDSMSYILQLRKILFTPIQRDKNLTATIVRNNIPFESDKVAMASVIFTVNEIDLEKYEDQNKYYYYNPNHQLIPITKDELQTKFDEKELEYIEKDNPRIPGIIENGGIKK